MYNLYVRKIITAIIESDYKTIMVYKSRLTDQEMNLINEIACEYRKTIIFAFMKDIIFNTDETMLIIE
ncbi:hypothetical protein [Clostridium beijerinckii]|uniref:hypothetical protein n=1 Tax=Clostridium beijerinckii TaxID=1520 RepID=UPI0013618551|nr:hypothetical protein [Clostridium beijerinckii]MZK53416.1 hypothetical protein [Clostridium beijerinckii]MZK61521.1 hypothetical protein [Clostridium beijerinckii]MZK71763.1 hypothetical protein [Clostridium beijerinckii]MZK77158.1 hypothetical protein [Clostridium beijerinckii]MZK86811.1 hypothetical protein [Clostridium beijerinckii]